MGFLLFPECPDLPSPGEPLANGREKEKEHHPVLILCDVTAIFGRMMMECMSTGLGRTAGAVSFPPHLPVPMTKRVRLRAHGGAKRARRAGSLLVCWGVIILLLIPRGALTVSPGSGGRPTSPSRPHAGAFKSRGDGNFHLKSSAGGTAAGLRTVLRRPHADSRGRPVSFLERTPPLPLFLPRKRGAADILLRASVPTRSDLASPTLLLQVRAAAGSVRAIPEGGAGEVEVMAQGEPPSHKS